MRLVSKILMKIRIEMFECKGGIVSVLLLFTALLLGPHLRFDEIGAYQETLNRFRTCQSRSFGHEDICESCLKTSTSISR